MSALAGLPILTAAGIRAAENAAIAAGRSVADLMEAAGTGVARWTARLASGAPILILCGPGNNGGDGYVAARILKAGGATVRVAAMAEPRTEAARAAASGWDGPVETLADAEPAPIVMDALLGTGASRPLSKPEVGDLLAAARLSIAVDLPSGLDADGVDTERPVDRVDVTLALGALKPAHLLQPGAALCGDIRVIDLGLDIDAETMRVLEPAHREAPPADTHKYARGMVAVVQGAMPGAALLAARAAQRAGAGYVALLGGEGGADPAALVRRPLTAEALADPKIDALVIGPGLGRDDDARRWVEIALRKPPAWTVIDGDALHLVDPDNLPRGTVLTPHAGEFDALFGSGGGSKIDRTRAAAERCGCVVVHKGPDTVIAGPNGSLAVGEPGSGWLASAGTGDVLAGAIAARLAETGKLFGGACDGVWMHARAAAMVGGGLIADDLPEALGRVRAGW